MKKSRVKFLAMIPVLALAPPAAPAMSSYVPANLVSGTVSGVSGNQIVVDGRTYSVTTQGPALSQLQKLQPGQQVDLVLNGPPGSAASQVVAVHVHATQG